MQQSQVMPPILQSAPSVSNGLGNTVLAQTSGGITPESMLPSTCSRRNAANCPNSVGMVPVKSLSYIQILFMTNPKLPNSGGIVPEKLHDVIEKDSRVDKEPIPAGICPPRLGFESAQCSLIAGIPTMYDRSPDMKPSTTYKN